MKYTHKKRETAGKTSLVNSQPFWVHHNPEALSVLACDKVSAKFQQRNAEYQRKSGARPGTRKYKDGRSFCPDFCVALHRVSFLGLNSRAF